MTNRPMACRSRLTCLSFAASLCAAVGELIAAWIEAGAACPTD